jgi:hypothetical protein
VTSRIVSLGSIVGATPYHVLQLPYWFLCELGSTQLRSDVSTVTRLRAEGSGVRIPAGSSKRSHTGPSAHSGSYSMGNGGSFLRVKQAGVRDTTHLHLVSRFKNECSHASNPLARLHGMWRFNFTPFAYLRLSSVEIARHMPSLHHTPSHANNRQTWRQNDFLC